jgi:3-oxo-5,6-didehydrosuberyl-CoA/3-oxoadipyl-CoA thiolase
VGVHEGRCAIRPAWAAVHARHPLEHVETIRDATALDSLDKLTAQPGHITDDRRNSKPLSDGSSAVVIASGDAVAELGVAPLAKIVGSAVR